MILVNEKGNFSLIFLKLNEDWLRFSMVFWHTFPKNGGDPFGALTKSWPWEDGMNSIAMAKRRMRANFEFIEKLGVDRCCFHDTDVVPDAKSLKASWPDTRITLFFLQ